MKQIHTIIDKTPFITDIRKEFYKTILNMRYEKILQYSYCILKTPVLQGVLKASSYE